MIMSVMPNERQWAVMESVDATLSAIEKIRYILQSLLSNTDSFLQHTEVGILNDLKRHEYDSLDTQSWYKKKDAFGSILLARMEEFYRTVEGSPLLQTDAATAPSSRKSTLECKVSAAMVEGMLVVKTPHLLNRNVTRHGGKGGFYDVDYHSFFAPEVERALDRVDSKIPMFFDKNICVLSVYREERTMLPDAENLDSKRIIDAILHRFPGSDGGKYCSIFQACFHDRELPEGAYFVLSKGFARVPCFPAIVRILRGWTSATDVV